MKYNLNPISSEVKDVSAFVALKKLLGLLDRERSTLIIAGIAIVVNSGLNLVAPFLIGHAIDTFIPHKDYHGVLVYGAILLTMYVAALAANYFQTKLMGTVGQKVLFNLRNSIFNKLQELPVAFFNQNKAGDLISRINNDTDKLNQFFSQTLMQFVGSIFIMIGAGIFVLVINFKLGAAALLPALVILIFTQLTSGWVKRRNAASLKTVGGMSAEIQESLDNFKVIVAFNRRDYFRQRFETANEANYQTAVKAGYANNLFTPLYTFGASVAQLVVLAYGVYLVSIGDFTLGLLISFLTYIMRFYDPLKQLAALWSAFQTALAGWDRISAILAMESDLSVIKDDATGSSSALLEFRDVSFTYPEGKEVLRNINFSLEPGKTYALVGPTGGGKTTTASLMARLYDPTSGKVLLSGRDIRSYETSERSQKIGFILQEPYLFTGTIRDNIVYGNTKYEQTSSAELNAVLKEAGLEALMSRFSEGLDTVVAVGGDTISLGQKQLIAFIRAVLRDPDLLILDEATANIDTVTEQLLEEILKKLPAKTTKVIIAHRLNTIENADEILFVNGGEVTRAGSMEHAVEMLLHGDRNS